MLRTARIPLLLALTALVAALAAAPAGAAAKPKVPYGFLGSRLITELTSSRVVPDAKLDQQFGLMADSGVESLRMVIDWRSLEPARGVRARRSGSSDPHGVDPPPPALHQRVGEPAVGLVAGQEPGVLARAAEDPGDYAR